MNTSHNHLHEPCSQESSFLKARAYLSDLSKPEKEVLMTNLGVGAGKICVENFPDEEDLTTEMRGSRNVLKFKDKIFDPIKCSGMGKVFLRKNIVKDVNNCGKPINILTLDMFEDEHGLPLINTIFIIQYDYDLDKGFITIPENSVLVFAGGSFRNGTVILKNTLMLPAGLDIEHFMSVNIRGNYKEGSLVYLRKHLRLFNGQNWINIGGPADFTPLDKLEIINVLKKYVNATLDIVSPFKITITPEKNYIETGEHDIKVSWDYNRLINNQDIRLESGNKYAIYKELNKCVREYTFKGIDTDEPVTIVISTTYKGETVSEAITLTFNQNPGLIIDDELNEDSTNPVTNKAITRIIRQLENNIDSVDEKFENYLELQEFNEYKTEVNNDLSEVNRLLNNKVDKVSGKGLSTNDFTNADKSKLNGIEAGAQKNPDLSGYATTASVNAAISSAVSGKQDTLPEGRSSGDVLKWNGRSWLPGNDEQGGSTADISREIRKLSLTKQSGNIQITYDGQSVGNSVTDETGSAEPTIVPNRFSEGEYEVATINGTKIYGKDTGGSGGSNVSWSQYTQTGNHIADITINGTTTNIYAPTGGGETTASQFKEMIFNRSESKPNTPTGGTYANPITSAMAALGWKDGPYGSEGALWFSTKMFSSDGASLGNWSEPEILADSEVMDVCYHSSERKPNPPTTHGIQGDNPNAWHDEGNENDRWLATSVKNNGEWSDWSIVKIKGERGDDGTSIKIVGSYADTSTPYLRLDGKVVQYFNPSEVVSDKTTLEEGDCLTVEGGNLDGHIIYLSSTDPQVWIDLGEIQGQSQYLHIKFSDDGGSSFTPNGGETPGKYIGMYTDSNPVDSSVPSDYAPWILFKGQDGAGYWFLYTVNSGTKPASPACNHVIESEYRHGFTDDNGVVWDDEPHTLTKGQYEWRIWLRDSEETLCWSDVTLHNIGVSDGNSYNLVFNNPSPVYYDLNSNKLTGGTLSWNFYLNGENKTNNYYYLVTSSTNPVDTDGNNSVNLTTSDSYKFVNVTVYPSRDYVSGEDIYSEQYVFPTKGLNGDTSGTGLRVTLAPDLGQMPCNLDGSSISGASVSTNVNVYYNESPVSATYQVITSTSDEFTASFTGNKLTVTALTAGSATQVNVPFSVTYNGNTYLYSFAVIRDKDGNVYTLDVNPQVYTPADAEAGKLIVASVYMTYNRANNSHAKTLIAPNTYAQYGLTLKLGSQATPGTSNTYTLLSTDNQDIEISLFENNTLIQSEIVNYIATGNGAQGLQGCVLRNCGLYNPNTTYVNEAYYVPQDPSTIRYIDYVVYPQPTDLVDTYYYMVAPLTTGDGRRTVTNVTPSELTSQIWIKATQMDFAYIKNLVADYIDAKTISTDELLIKRTNQGTTTIVAGMTKGDMSQTQANNAILWAGSNGSTQINIKESPFVVYEDGHMKATNAEITGDVKATSFKVYSGDTSDENNLRMEMTTWSQVSGEIDTTKLDSDTLSRLQSNPTSPVIVLSDGTNQYILNMLALNTGGGGMPNRYFTTIKKLNRVVTTNNRGLVTQYNASTDTYYLSDGVTLVDNVTAYQLTTTDDIILGSTDIYAVLPANIYRKVSFTNGKLQYSGNRYVIAKKCEISINPGGESWHISVGDPIDYVYNISEEIYLPTLFNNYAYSVNSTKDVVAGQACIGQEPTRKISDDQFPATLKLVKVNYNASDELISLDLGITSIEEEQYGGTFITI